MLPGKERSYKSVDSISSQGQIIKYRTEFLKHLKPGGTARHNLLLKLGTRSMLLRNLNPHKLCNDKRFIIKSMMSHFLEAAIMPGKYAMLEFIRRIPMRPTYLTYVFENLHFDNLIYIMFILLNNGMSK